MSKFMKETPNKFFQIQSNRLKLLQLRNKLSLNERTVYYMQCHKKYVILISI